MPAPGWRQARGRRAEPFSPASFYDAPGISYPHKVGLLGCVTPVCFWHGHCETGYVNFVLVERKKGHMASGRNGGVGPIGTILLMLVVVFVPIVGHIILTVIILGDDLTCGEKILWLLVVWLLPVIGPLLY